MRLRHAIATTAALASVATLLAAAPPPNDAQVFSAAARSNYCVRAQQLVAGTDLVSQNVVHDTIESFVESDATPYDTEDGRDLPLTTHQFITRVEHPGEGRLMDAVLSCKLKSGEAIQYHYGQSEGALGHFCTDAHADIADRVFDALTGAERQRLVYDRSDIVLVPDQASMGGGDWTSGQPQGGDFQTPTIARAMPDGSLALQAKALIVPTVGVDIPPFVGRNKQGTHYCHLIAPEHLRELVTGDVSA